MSNEIFDGVDDRREQPKADPIPDPTPENITDSVARALDPELNALIAYLMATAAFLLWPVAHAAHNLGLTIIPAPATARGLYITVMLVFVASFVVLEIMRTTLDLSEYGDQ